jgi:hypothetical protein
MANIDVLNQALTLMQNSLELIDQSKVAADVGAHLDLAICRLRDEIANIDAPARMAEGRG